MSKSDDETFLHAVFINDYKTVKAMLDNGFSNPGYDNNIAISIASKHGYIEIFKLLYNDKRVDPTGRANYAVYYAKTRGHREIYEILRKDKRVINYNETRAKLRLHLN